MNVKKFNKKGNEQYKILIQSTLDKASLNSKDYDSFEALIKNTNYTEEVVCTKKIENKTFPNRFEFGKYLNKPSMRIFSVLPIKLNANE